MNETHIIGNLTADPKLRTVNTKKGEQSVCDFTVAVNRVMQGKTITDFFRVTCWNKQAENAAKYLTKGRKVAVTGPVTARAYAGNDGKPRASLEIPAEKIEYLGGSRQEPEYGEVPPPDDGFIPVDDDELPF